MRLGIRVIDAAFVLWAIAWLAAGGVVYSSLKDLEDGGRAVVAAGAGLDETSAGCTRPPTRCRSSASCRSWTPIQAAR